MRRGEALQSTEVLIVLASPQRDYLYDVFLSYTRDHPVGTWVKDRFLRDFRGYLSEELGQRVRIFFDQEVIQTGEDWEEKLRWGLRHSKALVAICSARYFRDSDYCDMEWRSFDGRPRVPARYNDGEQFPEEAKRIQQADFSKCNLIVEAFYRNDQRAVLYEDNVRKLAQAAVEQIRAAPAFNPRFRIARAPKRRAVERMPLPRL